MPLCFEIEDVFEALERRHAQSIECLDGPDIVTESPLAGLNQAQTSLIRLFSARSTAVNGPFNCPVPMIVR
jgi:hypothetical protein